MAMFALVVDTSLMNVSISTVVKDLETTASGVLLALIELTKLGKRISLVGAEFE